LSRYVGPETRRLSLSYPVSIPVTHRSIVQEFVEAEFGIRKPKIHPILIQALQEAWIDYRKIDITKHIDCLLMLTLMVLVLVMILVMSLRLDFLWSILCLSCSSQITRRRDIVLLITVGRDKRRAWCRRRRCSGRRRLRFRRA
jgi:hypothetical protein